MAALETNTEFDFRTLGDLLEADDSVLSKSIAHLDKAGYARVTKGYVGNRPRTWVQSTAKGVNAYRDHLLALRAITEGKFE